MKNATIINVSNHNLTQAQVQYATVVELPDTLKKSWGQLTPETINDVVGKVKTFIQATDNGGKVFVHIAGHPSAVLHLVNECSYMETAYNDCTLVYAHSVRESVETVQDDGTVVKRNVFNFQGWHSYSTNERVEF